MKLSLLAPALRSAGFVLLLIPIPNPVRIPSYGSVTGAAGHADAPAQRQAARTGPREHAVAARHDLPARVPVRERAAPEREVDPARSALLEAQLGERLELARRLACIRRLGHVDL